MNDDFALASQTSILEIFHKRGFIFKLKLDFHHGNSQEKSPTLLSKKHIDAKKPTYKYLLLISIGFPSDIN